MVDQDVLRISWPAFALFGTIGGTIAAVAYRIGRSETRLTKVEEQLEITVQAMIQVQQRIAVALERIAATWPKGGIE